MLGSDHSNTTYRRAKVPVYIDLQRCNRWYPLRRYLNKILFRLGSFRPSSDDSYRLCNFQRCRVEQRVALDPSIEVPPNLLLLPQFIPRALVHGKTRILDLKRSCPHLELTIKTVLPII